MSEPPQPPNQDENPPTGDAVPPERRVKKDRLRTSDLRRRLRPEVEPPATVLKKAGPDAPQGGHSDLADRETSRVRLVPQTPLPPPWRVIFHATYPVRSTIGLDVRQTMTVGRNNPDTNELVDLDLTPYMAMQYGVSRQHAALIPTSEGLFLVDLGSKNGTWLNGLYLDPGQQYPLKGGDQLEFGLMKIEVRSVNRLGRS